MYFEMSLYIWPTTTLCKLGQQVKEKNNNVHPVC